MPVTAVLPLSLFLLLRCVWLLSFMDCGLVFFHLLFFTDIVCIIILVFLVSLLLCCVIIFFFRARKSLFYDADFILFSFVVGFVVVLDFTLMVVVNVLLSFFVIGFFLYAFALYCYRLSPYVPFTLLYYYSYYTPLNLTLFF